jgi:hypothetical protein
VIIVLDTNVIISALMAPSGPPAEIVNLWEAGKFEIATSPALLAELKRVLEYPRIRERFRDPRTTTAFLKQFGTVATFVEPHLQVDVIKEDPPDNRVLECTVAAGASYIVSGDDDLLRIKEYRGIVILAPTGFLVLTGWR